jgi:hypothetical protein
LLRFHDLRHTFGTRMIAKADIRRGRELRYIELDRERKPSRVKGYRWILNSQVLPAFGSMPVGAEHRADRGVARRADRHCKQPPEGLGSAARDPQAREEEVRTEAERRRGRGKAPEVLISIKDEKPSYQGFPKADGETRTPDPFIAGCLFPGLLQYLRVFGCC